jgi:hypothetical protein
MDNVLSHGYMAITVFLRGKSLMWAVAYRRR